MRLFIALKLPDRIRNSIAGWIRPLSVRFPELRWTSPENLHVTLRFLGDVDHDRVIRRMEALRVQEYAPVEFTLNRLGTFGRPPSILWLSGRFSHGIHSLAGELALIPDEKGMTESRRFHPHVTVARAGRGRRIPRIPGTEPVQGSSSRIDLVSSTLTGNGPVYRVIYSTGR